MITRLTSSPSYTLYQRLGRVGIAGPAPIILPPPPFIPDFYVSPFGGTGSGSIFDPWSLPYALGTGSGSAFGDGKLVIGNKVAIRGGTYAGEFISTVSGTQDYPIIFRQMKGERATITGNLEVLGSYCWYWGFELGNAYAFSRANHLQDRGVDNKFINLIVHDGTGTGVAMNDGAGGEAYGCIVYNNGSVELNDHGFYTHNFTTSPIKRIRDNISFNNIAFGFQEYAETVGYNANVVHDGNVAFNANGISVVDFLHGSDILIDGVPGVGIQYTNNFTYAIATARNAAFWAPNGTQDIAITDNIFIGGINKGMYLGSGASSWTTATVQRNLIYVRGGEIILVPTNVAAWAWASNIYFRDPAALSWSSTGVDYTLANWKIATGLGSTDTNPGTDPTGIQIFYRPNAYEPGRGHVIVYNWNGVANVSADLSTILSIGQQYEIVNAQDYYGTPVASGTYSGALVSLPMAGISPPVAQGRSTPTAPVTGPTFQVFVVRLQGA